MLKLNKKSVKELFPKDIKKDFLITSDLKAAGDQVEAIKDLCQGIHSNEEDQVLNKVS